MPAILEEQPKAVTPSVPSAPQAAPPPPGPTKPRGWKRAACWLALGGVFIAAAVIIDPLDTPASERLVLDPFIMPQPIETHENDPSAGLTHLSEDGLQSLGSLEGLSTTVWFYAGVRGPLASMYADDRDPLELVTLEELYRLAPELRLDTGIAFMGEVPVQADDWSMDW